MKSLLAEAADDNQVDRVLRVDSSVKALKKGAASSVSGFSACVQRLSKAEIDIAELENKELQSIVILRKFLTKK